MTAAAAPAMPPEPLPDPLSQAVARALAAAAAATDAAHEAEAALTARGAAAEAMRRTARRTAVTSATACGTSVVVLAVAGYLSLHSAGALRAAAEAQTAAGLAFVAQLGEFKTNTETLGTAAAALVAAESTAAARFAGVADSIAAGTADVRGLLAETGPRIAAATAAETGHRIDALEVKLIEALADVELSVAQAREAAPAAPAAPGDNAVQAGQIEAAVARLSGLLDRMETQVAAPASATAAATRPRGRPARTAAQRPAPEPAPNPFRFP